jgi:type IV secretory pathway VirB6-like protein
MISYIHAPVMAISFFILVSMWRFYACIDRMGFTRELGRRAPSMVHGDIVSATFAIMPFLIAAADWTDIVLPNRSEPISSTIAIFLSLGCLSGCMYMLRDSGGRFVGSWVGSLESALRTVAALGIITDAELAYSLDYIDAREKEGRGLNRIIANARGGLK